jgi:hypothetical protein
MGRLSSSPLLFWVWFKKQNAHSNKHSIFQNTLWFLFFPCVATQQQMASHGKKTRKKSAW